MFYVLVNSKGIEVRPAKKLPGVQETGSLVGIEGQSAFFEVASYGSFSEQGITILCDDEFLLKEFKPVLLTAEGRVIHGQCLIVGTNRQAEDFCLLNQKQVELVKKELRLIKPTN